MGQLYLFSKKLGNFKNLSLYYFLSMEFVILQCTEVNAQEKVVNVAKLLSGGMLNVSLIANWVPHSV